MTNYAIPSLMTISLLIAAFQWKWVLQAQPRERFVHFALFAAAWILAVLLMIFPHLPGPTQVVDALFEKLGQELIHGGKVGT
ncbi:hypothetical protein [Paenibacillus sacheonensis]|uniref:Uncharacterized protein n=1 Tax=Paenibacillus sacheonensis TaxID=742054 RepID=A0A7X5C3R1_9BACL|nr:hypothetical protein [Paenibacillus sacheonensis]MBM7566962.1 hypothetical protein [Paenibacillus sacheonensis]NBC71584.1 hypothetical protein [Paenibacillus sacheonensis]